MRVVETRQNKMRKADGVEITAFFRVSENRLTPAKSTPTFAATIPLLLADARRPDFEFSDCGLRVLDGPGGRFGNRPSSAHAKMRL